MKKNSNQKYHLNTIATHSGLNPKDNYGIINPPVYHVSTILSPTMKEYKNRKGVKYTYGRNTTPTSEALETAIANIYGAYGAVLAPSGMGAIANSLLSTLESSEHALFPYCVYDFVYF